MEQQKISYQSSKLSSENWISIKIFEVFLKRKEVKRKLGIGKVFF